MTLDGSLFRAVEREFYGYSYNVNQLQNLIDRQRCLDVVRSGSDFQERVDTGNTFSDPISMWFEQVEFLDEQIAKCRLRTAPIQHMLTHLSEQHPELVTLFDLRYRQKHTWIEIQDAMAISERTRWRLRKGLVRTGARFLGFLD